MADDGIRPDWVNKDFYKVLGVAKDADETTIKKAYRKLARENHPDSNPDDPVKAEKFKEISEAHEVIGNPEKRKKYDEVRAYGGGGFGGFGRGGGTQGGFDLNDLFGQGRAEGGGGSGGFGDMFGDLFGQGTRTRRPRAAKGQDLETSTSISFADALNGATIGLKLASESACPTCQGTGGKPGTRPHVCARCEGAGYVNVPSGGGFSMNETCPVCHGRQLVYDETCPTCHGTGRGTSNRTVQARIPAGVKDGARIRLKGKGGVGENGGPNGDLFVTVQVKPDKVFHRKGDDLTLEVPLRFDEAALGAEVKVPLFGGGSKTLKIPAGTQSGRTFRIRGAGVTKKDGTKGNLLVSVVVQVPRDLDDTTRAAVEAYRTAMAGADVRADLFAG